MAEPGQPSRAAVSSEESEELSRLRQRIDEIDAVLLEHLNDRARVVQAVGRLKQARGRPVFAAAREDEIVERLCELNPGPFPSDAIRPVFREIVSATRSLEEVLRVAYLGPEGTFSHAAASEQFGQLADLKGQMSIADVFAAVERGKAQLGVVPVENTTDGIVTETFDLLPDFEGTICGELQLRVSMSLLSRSGRLEDVARVVSHPQPLAQCRGWLDRHLAGVERHEAASTAAAARRASEDGSIAARLPDPVPIEVTRERLKQLLTLQDKIQTTANKALTGKVRDVLVLGLTGEGLLHGRTRHQAPEVDGEVFLHETAAEPGEIILCEIIDTDGVDLVAKGV